MHVVPRLHAGTCLLGHRRNHAWTLMEGVSDVIIIRPVAALNPSSADPMWVTHTLDRYNRLYYLEALGSPGDELDVKVKMVSAATETVFPKMDLMCFIRTHASCRPIGAIARIKPRLAPPRRKVNRSPERQSKSQPRDSRPSPKIRSSYLGTEAG